MLKTNKKFLSIVLALTMVFTLIGGMSAFAADPVTAITFANAPNGATDSTNFALIRSESDTIYYHGIVGLVGLARTEVSDPYDVYWKISDPDLAYFEESFTDEHTGGSATVYITGEEGFFTVTASYYDSVSHVTHYIHSDVQVTPNAGTGATARVWVQIAGVSATIGGTPLSSGVWVDVDMGAFTDIIQGSVVTGWQRINTYRTGSSAFTNVRNDAVTALSATLWALELANGGTTVGSAAWQKLANNTAVVGGQTVTIILASSNGSYISSFMGNSQGTQGWGGWTYETTPSAPLGTWSYPGAANITVVTNNYGVRWR